MATETPNYHLVKPDVNDFYDIGVPNGNMDLLDAELKARAEAYAAHAHTGEDGTVRVNAMDADTVDGMHAAEFASLTYVNERLSEQPVKYDLPLSAGLVKVDPYDSYYYANPWGEVTVHAYIKRADGGVITNGTALFSLPIGWYPATLLSVPALAAGQGQVGMVDLYSGNGGTIGNGVYYGADAPTIILSASFLAYREGSHGI